MSKDEILIMAKTFGAVNETWNKAFLFYNKDVKNTRLSMGCRPCYNKVLVYHLENILQYTSPLFL